MMRQSLNRTLYIADNLPILRGIDSESVDLIATDPPFNKGVKAFEGITAGGARVSYSDVWTWGDVESEWTRRILGDHPALYNVIMAANGAAGDDMGAFLCWLSVRALEMRRVLKPTGSLYLHCDHTAHAWVKAMLDAIFGRENFRNEIVWAYTGPGSPRMKQFNRKHDTILWYSKGKTWTFNRDDVRAPYKDASQRPRRAFDTGNSFDLDQIEAMRSRGKVLEDWWQIRVAVRSPKERTGYPTQKPLSLYERIIRASSNPGDIVLDPFAGCSTTCVAAERLGRRWIGVEINEKARAVIHDRLRREVSETMAWDAIVSTPTEPPERTDGGDAAPPDLRVVSRKRNAPRLSVREIREQLIYSNGQRCQGCGWEPPYRDHLQVEHKRTRSLGGVDDMSNLTLLCDPCKRLKSNKLTLAELREARVEEGRMDADWWEVKGRRR